MTAPSAKKRTVPNNTFMDYRADFRANHIPDSSEGTAEDFLKKLDAAFTTHGFVFDIHEDSIHFIEGGNFQCAYQVTAWLVKDSGEEVSNTIVFTVIGHPISARAVALDMALVDFANAYRQMQAIYARAMTEKATLSHPVPMAPAPQKHEGNVEVATPSPELQRALGEVPVDTAKSYLIDEETPDGLPILVDLFNVEGNPAGIALDAEAILRNAATTAANSPSMRTLWMKNEDNFEFIKDYAPDAFNGLLKLFKERDAVLKAEDTPVNHPGKVKEPVMKPRRRQRRPK